MGAQLHALPPLRQDLRLMRSPKRGDDDSGWLIYDPVRHAYHGINRKAYALLCHWNAGDAGAVIKNAEKALGEPVSEDDVASVVNFIHAQQLADAPKGGDLNDFAARRAKTRKSIWNQLAHSYVFFRIPLIKPHKFLSATLPLVAPVFTRAFWIITAIIGLLGLGLAVQRWDEFVATFFGFLSVEGAVFYVTALAAVKIAHEFGHAYAATRYGCRVTTMGISFILFFPVLYADTTDAWRLSSRRKRIVIDGAGMAAESIIAAFSTFLWSFLPDGSIRSVAFFLATVSWLMTLTVNLNPFMRFDGYYLLGDLIDFKNLQPRSFALARWRMREWLFKTGDPPPERLQPKLNAGLLAYAYGCWVYRFFLFVGIAVAVHAFIIKAVAIILSIFELAWFLGRPIFNELLKWPALLRRGEGRRRAATLTAAALGLALFLTPWRATVTAPAMFGPAEETQIFARLPGLVEEIYVAEGDWVAADAPLLRLSAPAFARDIEETRLKTALLEARLRRRAADPIDRALGPILEENLAAERARLRGLNEIRNDLTVRAPFAGRVSALMRGLHKGRWINERASLMRISNAAHGQARAYVVEDDIARLEPGDNAWFFPEDPLGDKVKLRIAEIAPAGTQYVRERALASIYGGGVAVRVLPTGEEAPVRGVFFVRLEGAAGVDRDLRGVVRIDADRRSPAEAVFRRASAVFLREAGA